MRTLSKNRKPQGREEASSSADLTVRDFDEIGEQSVQLVEHQSIAGFLRQVPRKWHIDEITRFGDKVGRTAEGLHVTYVTCVDRALGIVRAFPEPLLRRVYAIMAAEKGWPALEEPGEVEAGNALRVNDRARRQLGAVAEHITDPEIAKAVGVVMNWLERESGGGPAGSPPPLRAV